LSEHQFSIESDHSFSCHHAVTMLSPMRSRAERRNEQVFYSTAYCLADDASLFHGFGLRVRK